MGAGVTSKELSEKLNKWSRESAYTIIGNYLYDENKDNHRKLELFLDYFVKYIRSNGGSVITDGRYENFSYSLTELLEIKIQENPFYNGTANKIELICATSINEKEDIENENVKYIKKKKTNFEEAF